MSGFPVLDAAGVCERGCCEWDDGGKVLRYSPHLTCRYCGEDARDEDALGRPACPECIDETAFYLEADDE